MHPEVKVQTLPAIMRHWQRQGGDSALEVSGAGGPAYTVMSAFWLPELACSPRTLVQAPSPGWTPGQCEGHPTNPALGPPEPQRVPLNAGSVCRSPQLAPICRDYGRQNSKDFFALTGCQSQPRRNATLDK